MPSSGELYDSGAALLVPLDAAPSVIIFIAALDAEFWACSGISADE